MGRLIKVNFEKKERDLVMDLAKAATNYGFSENDLITACYGTIDYLAQVLALQHDKDGLECEKRNISKLKSFVDRLQC